MINNLDPNLKFIFEDHCKSFDFLDITMQIVDNNLVFNIYYKPTNSLSSLVCTSCYPSRTKNYISLLLTSRIVGIVTRKPTDRD